MGSRKLAEDLDKAIKELLAALDRTSNPVQEAVSSRSTMGIKRRTPLVKYVDLTGLPKQMRDWLSAHKIIYAEDVAGVDLHALAETPGIGRDSLGRFMRQVIEHDLYPDTQVLNDVMLKYRISSKPGYKG